MAVSVIRGARLGVVTRLAHRTETRADRLDKQQKEIVRFDFQPSPQGELNLQLQYGDHTISTCVVCSSVVQSVAEWPPDLAMHQSYWLWKRVEKGLIHSLSSGKISRIEGHFGDESTPNCLTQREGDRYAARRRG